MEADTILQGLVYTLFGLCGASSLIYIIRMRMRDRTKMKQSPSMEDLTSINSDDPQMVHA